MGYSARFIVERTICKIPNNRTSVDPGTALSLGGDEDAYECKEKIVRNCIIEGGKISMPAKHTGIATVLNTTIYWNRSQGQPLSYNPGKPVDFQLLNVLFQNDAALQSDAPGERTGTLDANIAADVSSFSITNPSSNSNTLYIRPRFILDFADTSDRVMASNSLDIAPGNSGTV